jgi:signal transduction histidine kinase/ActR/RegA family two-component response regulator
MDCEQERDRIFEGPGEMREYCRNFAWEHTKLGASEAWSQSLRTAAQIVLASPFPSIILWGSDLIQIYNDGYREILAQKHPRALGMPTAECWPEVWHINKPIYDRVWKGESISFEDTIYPLERLGELTDYWLTLSYSPVLNETGLVAGILVIVFDNTERILEQRRREKAELDLMKANQRKDEFLAMLAHELRNPMTTVRNGLSVLTLTHTETDPILQQTVSLMNRQVTHLVRMVDDLLDISRITQDKVELLNVPIDLGSLVSDAVNGMNYQYVTAGKELHLARIPDKLMLIGDVTRLTQAITNILLNGIRYTGADGKVWVDVYKEDNEAIIRVTDNGIGLAEDQLTSIFELFVQADSSLARSQGGLGIGLTMVQRLIALHDGHVEARSEGIGCGSQFFIHLPLSNTPINEPVNQDQDNVNQIGGEKILVIDDNVDSAFTLATLLKLKGYEVETCHGGLAGIAVAEKYLPHMILCDIGMPELDGYETAKLIRKTTWGTSIPLVALTGYGQDNDKQLALSSGFNGHLVKPVELDELLRVMKDNLKRPL